MRAFGAILAATLAASGNLQDGNALVKACSLGQNNLCRAAADYLLDEGVFFCGDGSIKEAAIALQRGCKAGEDDACLLLAGRFDVARTLPEPVDSVALLASTIKRFGEKCQGGSAEDCAALSSATSDDAGLRRAVELWRFACADGDGRACEETARRDLESPALAGQAQVRLESLCRGGRNSACFAEVPRLFRGALPPNESLRVEALLRVACVRGEPHGCAVLATLAKRRGRQHESSLWRQRACLAGDGSSCHMLADGLGRGSDGVKWRKLGCEAGVPHQTCPPPLGSCVTRAWPPGAFSQANKR